MSGLIRWETNAIPSKVRVREREWAIQPAATLGRVLGVSSSGYYAWPKRLGFRAIGSCLLELPRTADMARINRTPSTLRSEV